MLQLGIRLYIVHDYTMELQLLTKLNPISITWNYLLSFRIPVRFLIKNASLKRKSSKKYKTTPKIILANNSNHTDTSRFSHTTAAYIIAEASMYLLAAFN